jgi:2-dehydro-3-deoxyphosphogalactonate aldolase
MEPWRKAGADGFGLGSALYKVGMSTAEIAGNAKAFAQAWAEMEGRA